MGVFGMIFVVYAARNNCGLQKNKSLITALSFNLDQIDNLLILIKKFRNIKSYFYEGGKQSASRSNKSQFFKENDNSRGGSWAPLLFIVAIVVRSPNLQETQGLLYQLLDTPQKVCSFCQACRCLEI